MNFQKRFFTLPFILRILVAFVVILIIRSVYQWFIDNYLNKNNDSEGFGVPAKCTYYYMNGCTYCKKLDPTWNKVKQQYKGRVTLVKVNRENAEKDLDKYSIRGFPAIILTDSDGNHKTYSGDRSTSDILNFINNA